MTAAPQSTLSDERILEIAHRTATRYTHRSDPNDHSYGFVKHTLLDFARKVLAASPVAAPVEAREPSSELLCVCGCEWQHSASGWELVAMPDSARWPDVRNRGLLQAAKQAEAAVTRYIQSVEPRDWRLLYEAQSYLRPAIRREEEFRAAMKEQPSDGAALCAKGPGGCVAGECGKEEKRGR